MPQATTPHKPTTQHNKESWRQGDASAVGERGPRLPPLQPAARHQQEAHGEHRALRQPAADAGAGARARAGRRLALGRIMQW